MYCLFVVNLLKTDIYISIGLTRLAETSIRKVRGKKEGQSLGAVDKILSSSMGGALATWNQPIEVIRVEVICCSTQPRCILTVGCRCKTCPRRRLPQLTAQRS